MSKHPTEARREVTATDLQIIDAAIASHEVLYRNLWTTRTMLKEIGSLDQTHRGLKQGIEQVRAEGERTSSQLEQVRAELATAQRELVEKRKELAALTAEVEEKQRTLSDFSAEIDRITGRVAA
jgi:chromosome segregation ATPase